MRNAAKMDFRAKWASFFYNNNYVTVLKPVGKPHLIQFS